ncbi:MAG: SIS domain-containing protein [Candidatus Omnitrophica bacterium]|nr:SIS domain-containing protein [Candidatus Omnitrophota bacterium]
MTIKNYWQTLSDVLSLISFSDDSGKEKDIDSFLSEIVEIITPLVASSKKVIFIGNGGSASIASHMAIDFWKNAKIKAVCFNDPAQLTCLANDYGSHQLFSQPLSVFGDKGDVLFAISSSGKSENILNAVAIAKEKGLVTISLSGFSKDNPLRKLGNANIYVPSSSYGVVESLHAVICHCILDKLIENRQYI